MDTVGVGTPATKVTASTLLVANAPLHVYDVEVMESRTTQLIVAGYEIGGVFVRADIALWFACSLELLLLIWHGRLVCTSESYGFSFDFH